MVSSGSHNPSYGVPDGRFRTTRWSVVMAAGRRTTRVSRKALEALCRNYWPPLYVFARQKGHSVEDAEDLVQGFFARILERKQIAKADRSIGRFRTFLLAMFEHYLADEWDRASAQKRGGGSVPSSCLRGSRAR